jgi:ATP-binding cassette subfamily C protein
MAAAPAMPADACELRIDRLRVTPAARGVVVEGLRLVRGELTLVQGDSGIGKSSLLDALAGMLAPREFTARADGRSIGYEDYRQQVKHGAYVSQSVRPWQRTVRECLRWAAPDTGEPALRQVLADVGLDRRLAESPQGLDTELHGAASRLSGGELQRLLLAQVILRQPRIALLDEATGALDAASEIEVLAALKRRLPGCVLVVVSHRPGLAALAEQTLVIDAAANVRIVAQRPRPLHPPRAPRGATALDG